MPTKAKTFIVEGPNWKTEVSVEVEDHDDRSIIFEAATRGMEKQLNELEDNNSFDIGPIVILREKGKKKTSEKFVNAYICLNNCGMYKMAEGLRSNYKNATGNDLSLDSDGIS